MKIILTLGISLISIIVLGQEKLDPDKYYAESKTIFIESKVYGKKRELQIFIPDEYITNKEKNFKVMYLFDSQNFRIFNYVSGVVQLMSMNTIEPVIIVGIQYNSYS